MNFIKLGYIARLIWCCFFHSLLDLFLSHSCFFSFSGVGVNQMLLPVGTSSELFSHPPPLFPTSRLYNIRPFQQKDKVTQAYLLTNWLTPHYTCITLIVVVFPQNFRWSCTEWCVNCIRGVKGARMLPTPIQTSLGTGKNCSQAYHSPHIKCFFIAQYMPPFE